VDWEARLDPQWMLRAQNALKNSDLDAPFVFHTEDARYLMGYRHHLGQVFIKGNAVAVLARNHDPILWTMDFEHSATRTPWLTPNQIYVIEIDSTIVCGDLDSALNARSAILHESACPPAIATADEIADAEFCVSI
jgi:Xaa-Pro aminopeptidase